MKRTPIVRKTAHLRRKSAAKRRRNAEKRKRNREAEDELRARQDEFLVEFPHCAYPGCRREASEVHEICWGNGIRRLAKLERCTWLPSCCIHNRSGQGFHSSACPRTVQFAIKLRLDACHYDRERCNAIQGTAADSISEADVTAYWVKLSVDRWGAVTWRAR
jgi:hypothetical protein